MPGNKEPRNQDTKNQRIKAKENKESNKFQIKNLKGVRISGTLEIFFVFFFDAWFYFVFLLWFLVSWYLGFLVLQHRHFGSCFFIV